MLTKISIFALLIVIVVVSIRPQRAQAQDPFTFEELLTLVTKIPGSSVSYWQIPDTETTRRDGSAGRCRARIRLPNNVYLDSFGWTEHQLGNIGFMVKSAGEAVTAYDFDNVSASHCNKSGGGGSLQFTTSYSWLLIAFGLAALIASQAIRRKLIPIYY